MNPDLIWIVKRLMMDEGVVLDSLTDLSLANTNIFCEVNVIAGSNINQQCTGISCCLTDECDCSSSVFYCPRGPGCIPFSEVCDGVTHCKDGLDECMCEGTLDITCLSDESFKTCLTPAQACSSKNVLQVLGCAGVDLNSTTCQNIESVEENLTIGAVLAGHRSRMLNVVDLVSGTFPEQEECVKILGEENYTAPWVRELCTHLKHGSLGEGVATYIFFNCIPNATIYTVDILFDLREVCDGRMDCETGHDEMNCPGRFYCTKGGRG